MGKEQHSESTDNASAWYVQYVDDCFGGDPRSAASNKSIQGLIRGIPGEASSAKARHIHPEAGRYRFTAEQEILIAKIKAICGHEPVDVAIERLPRGKDKELIALFGTGLTVLLMQQLECLDETEFNRLVAEIQRLFGNVLLAELREAITIHAIEPTRRRFSALAKR